MKFIAEDVRATFHTLPTETQAIIHKLDTLCQNLGYDLTLIDAEELGKLTSYAVKPKMDSATLQAINSILRKTVQLKKTKTDMLELTIGSITS